MSETDKKINPEGESLKPKIWGDTTDPNNHNPAKFRYLIHGINPMAALNIGAQALSMVDQPRQSKQDGDQSINMTLRPEDLSARVSLSMSLIDQDHLGTWGNSGLIINAPEENVVITSSSDSGALNSRPDRLMEAKTRYGISSGDQLLVRSGLSSYNEVVALARTELGGELELQGFFAKKIEDGEYLDQQNAQIMQSHAARLNLPFVEVILPDEYKKPAVVIAEPHKIHVNFAGKRYGAYVHEGKPGFVSYNSAHKYSSPPPEEVEKAVEFVRTQVGEELASEMKDIYEKTEHERTKPKIEYDEAGQIKSIKLKKGYGKDEEEYWIYSNGASYRIDIKAYTDYITRSMQPGRPMSTDEYTGRNPIPTSSTDEVIKEVLGKLSPEERTTVNDFYSSIRELIDPKYESSPIRKTPGFSPETTKKFIDAIGKHPIKLGYGNLSLEKLGTNLPKDFKFTLKPKSDKES